MISKPSPKMVVGSAKPPAETTRPAEMKAVPVLMIVWLKAMK
jgi:hypothetical protein